MNNVLPVTEYETSKGSYYQRKVVVDFLTPGAAYTFGVRAADSATPSNEEQNTNIRVVIPAGSQAGDPHHLEFGRTPGQVNNGETWPGFGVAVVDEQGIIVTDSTATVTLTLESGSAPTGLAGTFEQNAGNQDPAGNSVPGTAVFYDIMYTTETASLPEQIVIEATAPGLIGGSVEINVANTGSGSNSAPVITSNGGGATADVNAAENQTAVTTVIATDADTGDTLTYSITGGADNSRFSVGSSSGILTFKSAPDYENPVDANTDGEFIIEVTVSDGTTTDVQTITVTVTDINDNAPVITSNGGGATADVNAAENQTAVTTITATDADTTGTLTYSITGGADNSHFSINESFGVLTFNNAKDYENPDDANTDGDFIVEVTVSDGINSDVQTITVTVTDVVGS